MSKQLLLDLLLRRLGLGLDAICRLHQGCAAEGFRLEKDHEADAVLLTPKDVLALGHRVTTEQDRGKLTSSSSRARLRHALQLAQLCHPQLLRTLTVSRVDNFVLRRNVHRHLKIALEGTDHSVHLRCASINAHGRELA